MNWGRSIFPHFNVNAPMPFVVRPPAPETVPGDIVRATDELLLAVREHDRAPFLSARRDAVEAARDALDAAILKHLRGRQ